MLGKGRAQCRASGVPILGEILWRENRATLYPESAKGINKINDASLFDLSSPPR